MNLFQASMSQPFKRLFVITGESNSGGYALNSEAISSELIERSAIKILDNVGLSEFQNLDIGTNNLVGHSGLSNGSTHGFELELCNRAEQRSWYNRPTYLVKAGQGGSTISQWALNGSYMNTFVSRVQAAQSLLLGHRYKTYVLFSLGINDAISGTNVTTWKSAVLAHFADIRTYLGTNTPIIMTEFQGMGASPTAYDSYTTAIQEISASDHNAYSVNVTGAALRDANHWNYSGMKFVSGKLLDIAEQI